MRNALAGIVFIVSAAGEPVLPAPEPYADDYVLVRKDVWDRVDGDSQKLDECKPALQRAELDISSLQANIAVWKSTAKELFEQRNHVKVLADKALDIANKQNEYIDHLENSAGTLWEDVDGPVMFTAGLGMCAVAVWGAGQLR